MTTVTALQAVSERLNTWLFERALPLWRERGFGGVDTGFVETIDMTGQPTEANHRARVQPRQVYCFAESGHRGWSGDWRTPAEQGLEGFDRIFGRPDGLYGALADARGTLINDGFDLYNHAFAFLAFSHLADAIPQRRAEMAERSRLLLSKIEARCRHPEAGFHEDDPPRFPLGSNPHMHLFEAALSSEATDGFDTVTWSNLTDEIADLCLTRFIDAETGALREFFDADWAPFEGEKGRVVEPGHQFEWAWLLTRYGERRGRADALAAARRLFEIAVGPGVCPTRDVAVMTLDDTFAVIDPIARLWPQTEWLKAAIRFAALTEGEERAAYLASAERAAAALDRFLATPIAGLWFDKMRPDGSFVDEAAPASTFYHIVCCIFELKDCLERMTAQQG
ncbi:AGE family epimerase/isomerase [Rhizobium sp. SG2393]|uniref:AGE family epimerase/isomerase n=1 Tax=Rhizobium sp. SG2393 TaxID=3276279 RepID=UPI00366E5208